MSTILRFLLLFVAAFVAWALWLGEVVWVKGWASLAWLDEFNWSSVPICAVIVVTSSYFVSADAPWRERTKFVAFGFALTMLAFMPGRWAIMEFFMDLPMWPGLEPTITEVLSFVAVSLATLVASGLAVSVGLVAAANRWLAPLHIWTTFVVVVALILVLPLSFATVTEFPALNGSTDEIHALKMGYPVLWTALLVPLSLRVGRRRHSSRDWQSQG
jgi:hypothetical protein